MPILNTLKNNVFNVIVTVQNMSKINLINPLLLIIFVFFTVTLSATERNNNQSEVGKIKGGINASYFDLKQNSSLYHKGNNSGFGVEFSYKYLESSEFRFSYSKLGLTSDLLDFNELNNNSISLDLLYFPTKNNFYLLAGYNYLDISSSDPFLDVKSNSMQTGIGYRYHLTDNSALYFESKIHYQLTDDYLADFSSQLGFIYYFGGNNDTYSRHKNSTTRREKYNVPHANDTVEKISKATVNYDLNMASVKEYPHDQIKHIVQLLNKSPDSLIVVDGHSCSMGNSTYNKKLSIKRAKDIASYLTNNFSIDESRIITNGYGEESLLYSEDDSKSQALNRRVEIYLVDKAIALNDVKD